MTIVFVAVAAIANPRATHAAHRGAPRKDQITQARARAAKMRRNMLRWPRTLSTACRGSAASTVHRNMMSQWTMPYNVSISNVAKENAKLATTSDQRRRSPGSAIAGGFSGCCTTQSLGGVSAQGTALDSPPLHLFVP